MTSTRYVARSQDDVYVVFDRRLEALASARTFRDLRDAKRWAQILNQTEGKQ